MTHHSFLNQNGLIGGFTRTQFLQVELQQQLNLLQDEVSQIRGVTEEQSYKLEKVLQRQRELYQEIENRVSQAYTQPAVAPATDYTQANDAQTYSTDLSENEAYERAVALIILIYKMSATEIVSFFKFFCLVDQFQTAYDKKQSNQASTFILINDLWLIQQQLYLGTD